MIPSRMKRVEELVKEEVALIIQHSVKDPRLDFVTVTGAKVSKDLRNANVFITVHRETEERIGEVMEALEAAAGYIRRELGQKVALRYLPSLTFHYDNTLQKVSNIDALLNQIHAEEKTS